MYTCVLGAVSTLYLFAFALHKSNQNKYKHKHKPSTAITNIQFLCWCLRLHVMVYCSSKMFVCACYCLHCSLYYTKGRSITAVWYIQCISNDCSIVQQCIFYLFYFYKYLYTSIQFSIASLNGVLIYYMYASTCIVIPLAF